MKRVRRWGLFYTSPASPRAHSHSTQAVIFHQTHLKCKIAFLMAQVVLWFPSTLPFHFLISDLPNWHQNLLLSTKMRGQAFPWAGTRQ